MSEKTFTANEVLAKLKDIEVIESTTIKPHIKPGHGSCCTCQKCGYHYDDCVCFDNRIITAFNEVLGDE